NKPASVLEDLPGTFLGFEVTDIVIVRLQQPSGASAPAPAAVPNERLMRATRKGSSPIRML
ncbi:hypothetical protein, partial [Bradyrhizobium sp.]|uniref:hypothetical protein n=1 Tax=Bradyrhizobium sp. TaxID=376 RepID=UPI003C77C803